MRSSSPPASENGDALEARESPVNTTTSQGSKTTLKYQVHWRKFIYFHFIEWCNLYPEQVVLQE